MDPGRQDEEGDCQDGQGDEERPAVVAAPDHGGQERDHADQEGAAEHHCRHAQDQEARPPVRPGLGGIPNPGAVQGKARPGLRDERPRVERVDGQPRVAGRRVDDLVEQADDGEPEGQAQDLRRDQPDQRRGQDPPGPVAGRPGDEVAPDDQDRRQRDQDPELGLDDRRHGREQGGALVAPAPQVTDGEEQDQRPDGVDLRPDRAVEPGDRHEQDQRGRRERRAATGSEVRGELEDGDREPQVGQDRGQLQEIARPGAGPAQGLRNEAQSPQDVQVAGRVVDEDRAVVDPVRPVPGELHRPAVERGDVDLESRPGQEDVCDDEPKDEAEREKDAERDGDVPKPHPGLLARPRPLARCGASQGERPP